MLQPEYACAVLVDATDRLWLQLRPGDARIAPGCLTCFGGRRHDDEDAVACLRRELVEELGWSPPDLVPGCELWQGARFIARFYRATTGSRVLSAREPGFVAVRAPWPTLPGLPLSAWHRAVLSALRAGRARVEV